MSTPIVKLRERALSATSPTTTGIESHLDRYLSEPIVSGLMCPYCDGTGELDDKQEPETCSFCKGRGFFGEETLQK
jgi:DnaJ-class molecular chaperone